MSEYQNYVSDFPARCAQVLESLRLPAAKMDREVTLLLSVATAGLNVPYERLRENIEWPHPLQDRDRYATAAKEFDRLRELEFLGSPVWPRVDSGSWKKGKVRDVFAGGPDTWEEIRKPAALGRDVKVGTVLSILRNALAHGNIVTRGRNIREIIFLSRDEAASFRFLAVSPPDFREALLSFFQLLQSLELSEAPIGAASDVA